MDHYSPLRYPGGKRRLSSVVTNLIEFNALKDVDYFEPYAGGASLALGLLKQDLVRVIHLNDLARPVYAFWHTALKHPRWMCNQVASAKLSISEWRRQRAVFLDAANAELKELGFATLYLNRVNRSGILSGGVIGGQKQDGKWKLGARFNREGIITRIKGVAALRDKITIYQLDAMKFIRDVVYKASGSRFMFVDPPYIQLHRPLYLNNYGPEDHKKVARCVERSTAHWVVTYDVPAIDAGLFGERRRMVYSIKYTAKEVVIGQEVMYFSDSLNLPRPTDMLGPRMSVVRSKCRMAC